MRNKWRAGLAEKALDAYCRGGFTAEEDYEIDTLTDLLTDLMHLFTSEKFEEALEMARVHFFAEVRGDAFTESDDGESAKSASS